MDQIHGRHREKRSEYVGVLKGALGAAIECEVLRARNCAEIAENAEQRGNDGRCHPGIEDQPQALVAVFDDRGVEHRR
ncbi:hypothetical protein D9M70_520550 [compost metagenome]